ncbi:methionine--tRNA ligase [Allobaculum sp. JKK-2023]|uniref:methionine--tRNA ligase n=1 Tax=Allobaculum sp. JKK-2023 TaxID=3108943 RepID=UPI002B059FAE|nr:methionine--tRNA ligase [Allobaculum sp. JKK-2023]
MDPKKEPYFLTTAIAYTSGRPHIGNTYEIILSDAIARFKRAQGYDVFFQTGTDEHGQKIEEKAAAAGVSPQEFVDNISDQIRSNWNLMNTSYDYFIRTTDQPHVKAVQKIFKKLYEQGDIYKGEYEGWYCTPCESFWTESQLVDGNCPDCGRPVHKAKEEAYFFNMQKYADRLMEYIETHPDFIQPESRKNEMINNFLKPGLQDLCVSRTSFSWGIPVDFDDRHVVYVWLDALTNYITSLGYDPDLPLEKQPEAFQKYWPATHIIGKDILRFHTIYWPIFLMALGLPLPKKVFGHPWMLIGDGKMSKSKGNVIYAEELVDEFGVDAVRYYCLHEMPFAQDGTITWDLIIERINSDLANVLGNLLSRTIAMSNKYFDGAIENPEVEEPVDQELKEVAAAAITNMEAKMDAFQVGAALDEIFTLLRRSNKYIDETEPWKLAKDPEKADRLKTVLYNLLESLRIAGVLLESFMPETSKKMLDALNTNERSLDSARTFGLLEQGGHVAKSVEPLFKRIDPKEFAKEAKINDEKVDQKAAKAKKKAEKKKKKEPAAPIEIDDFAKVTLQAGKILDAKVHPDADKLLVETVDLGEEAPRQIVSGIAKAYKPEDLIGKMVMVVSNLKPAQLRGVESQGMLLCTTGKEGPRVVFLDDSVVPGTTIR